MFAYNYTQFPDQSHDKCSEQAEATSLIIEMLSACLPFDLRFIGEVVKANDFNS